MTDRRRTFATGDTARRALPRSLRPLLVLGLLLPLLIGARDCERVVVGHECDGGRCGSDGTCLYDGERHEVGDSFPSDDGCNTCSCQPDGEVACTLRACVDGCGGLAGVACANDEYCNYPPDALCGAADATGTCAPKPQACDAIYDPVCGCDDRTYGNACEAAANGVSVVRHGECDGGTSGDGCGGLAGIACPSGEYCNYPEDALCGAADQTGTCSPIPQACDTVYDPVCGCDDQTYGNACEAAAQGVSVAHTGACDPATGGSGSGDDCGGLAGLPCAKDEFCDYPEEAQCGAADQTGTCTTIPQACTLEYAPVCGCDDMTYGNKCAAEAASVSVAHVGECDPVGGNAGECGGIAGIACPDGEFCSYPVDAQCGAADRTGTCKTIPQACTREYSPVCGCDDVTYGNLCMSEAAGISVVHTGECTPPSGGEPCGGLAGLPCGNGEFCNYPIAAQCGAADQTGTCQVIPQACTLQYDPVCGCDGMTYGNDCAAAAAGVSVAATGECP